jgi:hypothetical protein
MRSLTVLRRSNRRREIKTLSKHRVSSHYTGSNKTNALKKKKRRKKDLLSRKEEIESKKEKNSIESKDKKGKREDVC